MRIQTIIKKGREIYRDRNARSRYILHFSLAANIAFALLELAEGLYFGSMWLVAIGVYYAVLGVMRFSLLRSIRSADAQRGKKAYFRTAILLNVLTLTMTGIFAQLIIDDQSFHYPGVLIYAMALWAFIKIILAVKNLIRRRKEEQPILAAAHCLSFAAALMSILALQTALISQFGGDAVDFAHNERHRWGGDHSAADHPFRDDAGKSIEKRGTLTIR